MLLSTCHRVELYAAAEDPAAPIDAPALAEHLANFHNVPVEEVRSELVSLEGEEVVRHLFRVAASLDSMVLGEAQILSQVKQAYELARQIGSTGPVTHGFFQAALRVARRVASETTLHRHRVSIPSVAIADFASRIFERFDDKRVLVIGAGKMAQETLHYLADAGARQITVLNRDFERAQALADQWHGRAVPWDELADQLVAADLVVSTTGADRPVVTLADYQQKVARRRYQRPLFILDLAMPRDFEPAIGEELGVYLYGIDDLSEACDRNRKARAERAAGRRADHRRGSPRVRRRNAAPRVRARDRPLPRRPGKRAGCRAGAALRSAARAGRALAARNPPVRRPAGGQDAAPAAGIAARRIPQRHRTTACWKRCSGCFSSKIKTQTAGAAAAPLSRIAAATSLLFIVLEFVLVLFVLFEFLFVSSSSSSSNRRHRPRQLVLFA